MHIYTRDYIRMGIPALYLMVENIRLLYPLTRLQLTQCATIKPPIDAVKFSNTLQLSPKYQCTLRNKNIYLLIIIHI